MIKTTIMILLVGVAAAMIFTLGTMVVIYFEGYDYGTPLLNKTITVANMTDGIELQRNPGFVDTNGDGYIMIDILQNIVPGETYKVKYFCGKNDNLRKVVNVEWIPKEPIPTPVPVPTPDPFLCRVDAGVCA